eukprot:CAMPEP_0119522082 /NCGR_PEP_ID=MMETSP1344-20130328/37569_1 /TAXON_ID=236787 /ORGANISM="Florenciella parvula, Strain CCMP2471" /LENGTH=206 /DNA_ID=CAMNT_0007560105 /DNA_START=34 /DNA_END=651 /DNA_ORIENTATION=+
MPRSEPKTNQPVPDVLCVAARYLQTSSALVHSRPAHDGQLALHLLNVAVDVPDHCHHSRPRILDVGVHRQKLPCRGALHSEGQVGRIVGRWCPAVCKARGGHVRERVLQLAARCRRRRRLLTIDSSPDLSQERVLTRLPFRVVARCRGCRGPCGHHMRRSGAKPYASHHRSGRGRGEHSLDPIFDRAGGAGGDERGWSVALSSASE